MKKIYFFQLLFENSQNRTIFALQLKKLLVGNSLQTKVKYCENSSVARARPCPKRNGHENRPWQGNEEKEFSDNL